MNFTLYYACIQSLHFSHSMARANLKKSVWLVTNTTAASITYLRGPELASIEIPPFKPFLWSKFSKIKKFKKFRIAPNLFFFFCFTIHKKLNKSCFWEKLFLFLKIKIASLKILLLKFYEVRAERGDFNWCWFLAS